MIMLYIAGKKWFNAQRCLLFVLLGSSLVINPVHSRQIIMTLYTVQNGSLKMSAQIDSAEAKGTKKDLKGRLELFINNKWVPGDTGKAMTMPGWVFHFRVNNWDDTRETPFKVLFDTGSWSGIIRKNPIDQKIITIGIVSCKSPNANDGGTAPVTDIVSNILSQSPDVISLTGDQVYNQVNHNLNWRSFAYEFAELTRDVPTTVQVDDHDVGQANLWGSDGKASTAPSASGDDGGYVMPPDYVNMVQDIQTWHLPDPYDPTVIKQGIKVYYTNFTWGEISFAILEDRKWKTGPREVLTAMPGPRWDWITDPKFDVTTIDVPKANLLGARQQKFLRSWAADWTGAKMKVVLTQTPYACLNHLGGANKDRLVGDLDSDGWPQTGRNNALREIRRAFAFTIAGDQHLGTVVQMGIDDWKDAGWTFTTPAAAVIYPRWWMPLDAGLNIPQGLGPEYGDHYDGFKNKITMHAYANPGVLSGGTPKIFTDRSAGFGIVKIDKDNRTITMTAWPRNVDIAKGIDKPYPGWPITVTQDDNYGRKVVEYLPTLDIRGMANPVVQVIDPSLGSDSIVYTIRIQGSTYRPKVFKPGVYSIRIGEFGTGMDTTLTSVKSLPIQQTQTLVVNLGSVPIAPKPKQQKVAKGIEVKWFVPGQSLFAHTEQNQVYKLEIRTLAGALKATRIIQGPGKFAISLPNQVTGKFIIAVTSELESKSFEFIKY